MILPLVLVVLNYVWVPWDGNPNLLPPNSFPGSGSYTVYKPDMPVEQPYYIDSRDLAKGSTPSWKQVDPQENITTYLTPYDGGQGETAFIQLLNSTKKKIRMCAYGFTDPQVCDALIAAKNRGVDIAIVMDKTEANGVHQLPLVESLQGAGIDVQIGRSAVHNQLIHAKFTVVDDQVVEDGSWNYSPSASQQDNDINIIYSVKRAQMFDEFFNKIYAHIAGHTKN